MNSTRKIVAEMLACAGRRYPFHKGRTRIRRMMDDLLPKGDYPLKAKIRHAGPTIQCPRSDVMSLDLYTFGDYEEDVVRLLTQLVGNSPAKTPVLVDVGANLGTMSLPLAMRLGCDTVSFEPQPMLSQLLRDNAVLNKVDKKVRVVGKAVGAQSGKITFHINPDHLATASIGAFETGVKIEVEIERLDAMVTEDEWLRTAILKVDVEGYERDVFAGAAGLMQKHRPPVVFEVNLPALEGLGQTPSQVVEPLREYGYNRFLALDEVLYPSENGVNQPANIVAFTEEHAGLPEKLGFRKDYVPAQRKLVMFSPIKFD